MKRSIKGPLEKFFPWFIPLFIIAAWQLLSWSGAIPERILPAPSQIIQAGIDLTITGELSEHMGISLWRALVGFLIGGIAGFVFGLLNGVFRFADLIFDTSIQMLRNIPHLALILSLLCGLELVNLPKYFL